MVREFPILSVGVAEKKALRLRAMHFDRKRNARIELVGFVAIRRAAVNHNRGCRDLNLIRIEELNHVFGQSAAHRAEQLIERKARACRGLRRCHHTPRFSANRRQGCARVGGRPAFAEFFGGIPDPCYSPEVEIPISYSSSRLSCRRVLGL